MLAATQRNATGLPCVVAFITAMYGEVNALHSRQPLFLCFTFINEFCNWFDGSLSSVGILDCQLAYSKSEKYDYFTHTISLIFALSIYKKNTSIINVYRA